MENKEIIEKFLLNLDKKGLKERRKRKYIILLKKFDKISLTDITREQIDQFFSNIKNSNLAETTKDDYWRIFKIFLKWMKPEINLSEYRLQIKKKFKLPEDILSVEEIKRIVVEARTIRDRAMLSLLFDSGCRPSELLGLRNKDLTFDENGIVIRLNGKTGMRSIRIITTVNSTRFLKEYLLQHKGNPETYVFDEITVERLNQIVKGCSKRAGITKRINSYIFRHSRATFLANYFTEQQMKIYCGWSMDSKMVGVYVHLSGRDLDNRVIELNRQIGERNELVIPNTESQ